MNLEAFERLPLEKKQSIRTAGIREFAVCTYVEASTDRIASCSRISKGLLFYYFGTKKEFYLYCLKQALETLMERKEPALEPDFYAVLFSYMDQKMQLCMEHPEETHFVNMASRESAAAVKEGKLKIFAQYMVKIQQVSEWNIKQALERLDIKQREKKYLEKGVLEKGLLLYVRAVINQYLIQYQETPDAFFENRSQIKTEMKEYLDLMLYGICKKEG